MEIDNILSAVLFEQVTGKNRSVQRMKQNPEG